ncbi:MAG TPA: anti-sigma factor [Candidatus Kapabacteria bacterium]|nr:anti-sigma factor [Candidatus Kapabacteria bacterium]
MTHREAQALIHPYLDNELDSTMTVALLEHCSTCEICNARLKEFSVVKSNTFRSIPTYSAPDKLKDKFAAKEIVSRKKRWRIPVIRWGIPLATSFALGILAMMFVFRSNTSNDSLTDEIVWDNIHALKSNHLIDVASSDKHTVKPWFAGKTDFSPIVIDLAAQGFPLLGARAEYLGGNDVAALVYSNGKHYITLYQWVGKQTSENITQTVRGYHTLSFTSGEMMCVAVSDASEEELKNFRATFQKEVSGQ